MTIQQVENENGVELLLEGRMDTNTASQADEAFAGAAEQYSSIVLNMKGLEYVSSAGLRVLKKLYVAMKQKDGNLVLRNVDPMVMEVFEMTGFSSILKIE